MIGKRMQMMMVLGLLLLAGLVWPAAAQTDVCDDVTDIPASECVALVAFYESTDGANWTTNDGWLSGPSACDWYGVACLDVGGQAHVLSLELQSNKLSGPLPASLPTLTYMATLDLFDNQLTGELPPLLGTMPDLSYLDVGLNMLSGAIPYPLTGASSFLFYYLDGNQFSGPLPAGFCTAPLFSVDVGHNMLDVANTDPCFDSVALFDQWDKTQTVPPLGVAAAVVQQTTVAGEEPLSQVMVSWTPIAFSDGPGGYLVLSGPTADGPFGAVRGQTGSKEADQLVVTVPGPPTGYYFVVRTFSTASDENKTMLVSDESSPARAAPVAITLLAADAASPALYAALLGPLLLLLLTGAALLAARRR